VHRKEIIKKTRRAVIKIGSAVLAGKGNNGADESAFYRLAGDLSSIRNTREIVIVSSGAIAVGMKRLGMKEKAKSIPEKQAVAAIGQVSLMAIYGKAASPHRIRVAQILLTHDDLSDRRRFLNAKNTLRTLLEYRAVPIINENDTVAVEEIKFGDNDNLSALVTNLAEADLLVILTDIAGLYSKDPKKMMTPSSFPLSATLTNTYPPRAAHPAFTAPAACRQSSKPRKRLRTSACRQSSRMEGKTTF